MAPQLTFGKPIDFSADVPVFPPGATAFAALAGVFLWKATGVRLQFLPTPLAGMFFRLSVVAAIAAVSFGVLSTAGKTLQDAGSGTLFLPVNGLATAFPYDTSRNPMYAGLVFACMPGAAIAFNTGWVFPMMVPLFLYLHLVVISAEEALLTKEFGEAYAALCSEVPRWGLFL